MHTWFCRVKTMVVLTSPAICVLCFAVQFVSVPLLSRSYLFIRPFFEFPFCVISSHSSSLPYAFSLFLTLSVFSLLRSPSLPPLFSLQRTQAFLVTVGVHHGGEGCQQRDVPPD